MNTHRFNLDTFLFGLFFIVVGFLYLLDALDTINFDGFYVIPAALVLIGISIILGDD